MHRNFWTVIEKEKSLHKFLAQCLLVNLQLTVFLLSGYLIVKSWHTQPCVSEFLKKRILRIYPAFIIASLLSGFLFGPLEANPSEYFSVFSLSRFLTAMFLLQPTFTPPIFQGQPYPVVNGSMWTIGYEFICYLGVLSLGKIGAIKKRSWWFTLACFTMIIFLLCKEGRVEVDGHLHVELIREIITLQVLLRLSSFFLVGGCYFLFKEKIQFKCMFALLAALALIIGLRSYTLSEPLIAIFGGYLIFYFAQLPVGPFSLFNKLPDVSYVLYLYGWPVQKLLIWYTSDLSAWGLFSVSLFVSGILRLLSWQLIEKPCLKWKERRLIIPNTGAAPASL